MRRKRCRICKELFTPYKKNHIICDSKICKNINRRLRRRKEEREFNCIICGALSWTAKDEQVTCATKECQKKHALNLNKNHKHKQMAYMKKHNYSNKETWKKIYSDEELVYILVQKHFNAKGKDIAKKLKRDIKSISYKYNNMLKNKDEYFNVFKKAKLEIAKI